MDLLLKKNLDRWISPRYLELLQILVTRNLKGRYRGSFLGIYWSLLHPIFMTVVYTAVFGAAFSQYYDNSTLKYILAAFTGLTIIHFFSGATNQALVSIVASGGLLNKIKLPMSVFPLSMIVANVFQFSMGVLPFLAIITLIISRNPINVVALCLPLLALTLVCMGVGFLVAALYVFFRDLPYFYELVTFLLWITSPIFYPAEIVPESVRPFLLLNPLSPIIESLRQISLSGAWPDMALIGHALLNGVIILTLGWSCFRAWQNQFMDLL